MIKPPLVTFCSILGLFTVAPTFAGSTGYSSQRSVQGVAEREIVRRQDAMDRAQAAIQEGDAARKGKDLELAVQKYRLAVDLLPESESTRVLRGKALALFGSASVRLAEQRIAEGRYADAEVIAKTVLEDRYAPGYRPAVELLANLEQPDYYNKTITPRHHANVEEVKKLLIEARGFYDTGRYDLSFKRYDQVLNIDPYNISARKGQEEVNRARSEYATEARNMTRSQMLWQVDNAWGIQPRKYGTGGSSLWEGQPLPADNPAAITAKLNRIVIPRVEFRDATLPEAIDFLKRKSHELDVNEPDPNRRGVNIVLQTESPSSFGAAPAPAPMDSGIPGLDPIPAGDPTAPAMPAYNPESRITLSLANVPLAEVLRYITQLANMKVKIDPYAVAIVPLTAINDVLLNREFKVPPGFLNTAPGQQASSAPSPTIGGNDSGGMNTRMGAKVFFENQGVQFPPGASATFVASNSTLLVRNTQEQLDLIETIVDAMRSGVPLQVEIEAKFVEISQNNLKELGFDWLLGAFNAPGSQRVFGSGGTSGTGNSIDPANFPFVDPFGNVVGGNPLTAGNRTGSGLGGAISANAIDALLFPTAGLTSAAPGIFGISGVFTDPQFQVVIRALNQKKGVDLLSSPRITTKSGNRAKIEIIREFRFPTEFTPPQIPQTVGNTGGSSIGGGGSTSVPVTPTTPTSFETRNTGVTLDVEPVVGSDNTTIDLNLQPEVVEFEGFINYGSPILAPSSSFLDPITNIFTSTPQQVITPNVINQPIFSTRRVTTSVSVWDGQTVALGGLMREDVQKVEDKVPLLGDIPLVGRLFRSSVDQHLKRNLIIFVTARLINPAGEPLVQDEEEEEVIESMIPDQLSDAPMPLFSK